MPEKGRTLGMNLLLYANMMDGAGERLQRVIEAQVPEEKREVYRNIDLLTRRLRQPAYNLDIAVLVASCEEDLQEILSIGKLLRNVRIILILPDRKDSTVTKGHALRPRYLSYVDSNFEDISIVLEKMAGDLPP